LPFSLFFDFSSWDVEEELLEDEDDDEDLLRFFFFLLDPILGRLV